MDTTMSLTNSVSVQEKKQKPLLTKRELEIVQLYALDFTGGEIAKKLFIAPRTVEKHRTSVLQKLSVHSIAAAVYRACQLGVLIF